jgi:hypothetical protein
MAKERNYINLVSGKFDPGMAFSHWYFESVEMKSKDDSDGVIFEGFDDEKIDAIDISEDELIVKFLQFKNHKNIDKGIGDDSVDGLIVTIDLMLANKSFKSTRLNDKIKEIKSAVRSKYIITFISSGQCLSDRQRRRLSAKISSWNGSSNAFSFEEINLQNLQEMAYSKNLPTIEDTIDTILENPPYQAQIGSHKSLIADLSGIEIAKYYEKYGEKLLQQNIRNSEGDTSSNNAIYFSATSKKDGFNFYFYNNGITIMCENWNYDILQKRLELKKPQIVNGGQTVRQINKAFKNNELNSNVRVVIRVISSDSDKEFSGNVAVNLNNQTIVRYAFLRSNHPFFIQMQSTLLTLGWYLERKVGDWEQMSSSDRSDILSKISSEEKIICLQECCQAYMAFYKSNIDLSKKNPRLLFISKSNGGNFEDLINDEFTPERLICSWIVYLAVEDFKDQILTVKRKKKKLKKNLINLLGNKLKVNIPDLLTMIPQSTLMTVAILGNTLRNKSLSELSIEKTNFQKSISKTYLSIYKKASGLEGAWPTKLKSQTVYNKIIL